MMIRAQALGESLQVQAGDVQCLVLVQVRGRAQEDAFQWMVLVQGLAPEGRSQHAQQQQSTSLFFLALSAANSLWLAHIAERIEHDLQMLF